MKKFLPFLAGFLLISAPIKAQDLSYEVTAQKLDKARNNLSPKTYGTAFNYNRENIDNLPQGQASSINQLLLRAPGVTQDSYGQLHIRNDHSNIQYRINDVIIPEGISGFGNVLDARFIDSLDLLTGALPAQYGYRTAGVVEIKTKERISKDNLPSSGYSEIIYGDNRTAGVNQQFGGFRNNLNYFVSGSYLQNSRGLESPTAAKKSIHNDTKQDRLFGYFSYLIDSQKKLSLIVANATNRFEIPNVANEQGQFSLQNFNQVNSALVDQNQVESNRFAILALQGVTDNAVDYQIASFVRHNELKFRGDKFNDLVFLGSSSNNNKSGLNYGLQGDFSKKINAKNTLRTGFYFSDNIINEKNNSWTFLANDQAKQISTVPLAINDNSHKSTQLYSWYLQNEYRPIEKLTLNGGLRFDKVNSQIDANHLSPRFNSVYKFNDKVKIHAGYSRFFTAPKAELLSNLNIRRFEGTTNAPENFNNARVRPEKTDYFNGGVSFLVNKQLTIAIDGYYKNIRDMLDEGQFGKALIFKPFNYARAKVHGLEIAADYKLNNFSSFANIAWQKARAKKINSGQYLHENAEIEFSQNHYLNPDHAQRITASAGMAYKFATKTQIGFDVLYGNGLRRGEANTLKMPSYSQLNIFATQKIKGFNFRFSINNVLDKKYALRDGSGIGVQSSQFAARRSAYLIASKEF